MFKNNSDTQEVLSPIAPKQLRKCAFFTTLDYAVYLPIILPFSSVTEMPTGTEISQSFPLEPFSALTLQKHKLS